MPIKIPENAAIDNGCPVGRAVKITHLFNNVPGTSSNGDDIRRARFFRSVTSPNSTLFVLISGSGTLQGHGTITIKLRLDGEDVKEGELKGVINTLQAPYGTFISKAVVIKDVAAGAHAMEFEVPAGDETKPDSGCFFNVTIVEYANL